MKKLIALGLMLLFLGMTISSTGTRMFIGDNEPPVTTCTLDPPEPNGESGYYVTNVTVTLTSWDDDGIKDTDDSVDSEDDKNNGDTSDTKESSKENNKKSTDTPGFAILTFFFALIALILINKRRR